MRWTYLPTILPYLARMVRSATPEKVRAQARALRPLIAPTVPLVRELARDAGAEELIHQRGHLYVYRSAEALAKDALAWALRRENGVEIDEFDADELRQLEPVLSREYVRGLLVRENGHTSNPHRLVTRLVEQFRREGGEIVRASALGFRLDGKRLTAIRTDAGELPADAAIVCAGAWSKPLAAALGDKVPLETERGYHLMIRDPEAMPRIPTADADGKFVATPMELGLRLAGTVELAGLKAPPDWRRSHILLTQARRMLPGLAAEHPEDRITTWMGHRPALPDLLPVIGPSRATPGRDLRLRPRPYRHDLGADDRADRRRPRRRPPRPDRHFSVCRRPVRLSLRSSRLQRPEAATPPPSARGCGGAGCARSARSGARQA